MPEYPRKIPKLSLDVKDKEKKLSPPTGYQKAEALMSQGYYSWDGTL